MTTTETDHKHMFPLPRPGVFTDPGPCDGCGKTRDYLLSEEAQAVIGRYRLALEALASPEPMTATFASHGTRYAEDEFAARRDAARIALGDDEECLAAECVRHLEREVGALRYACDRIHEEDAAQAGQLRAVLRKMADDGNLEVLDQLAAIDDDQDDPADAEPEGVPVTVAMLAAAFRRLRVVTVHHDGMPFEHGPLAAAIISGFAGDAPGARATVSAKAAIEDAARDLNLRPGVAKTILAAFPPPVQGVEIPLAAIFDGTHPRYLECDELRTMYTGHPAVRSVIDAAVGIEGRKAVAS
jgi:hypothetical protein